MPTWNSKPALATFFEVQFVKQLSCILFDEEWTVILKVILHSNNLSVLSSSNALLKTYIQLLYRIVCYAIVAKIRAER